MGGDRLQRGMGALFGIMDCSILCGIDCGSGYTTQVFVKTHRTVRLLKRLILGRLGGSVN